MVIISAKLADRQLARLDAMARQAGITRSACLRALIDAGAPAGGLPSAPPSRRELDDLEMDRLLEVALGDS